MAELDIAQLAVPIIQAPMAGGPTTPGLVAAVAETGAVGSFGFAYTAAEKINDDLEAARGMTGGIINANFFVFDEVALPDEPVIAEAVEALAALPIAGDAELKIPQAPFFPDLEKQLEPVWKHKPAIVTFHFGIPSAGIMEKARGLGISIGITATNPDEAAAIEKAGADFIVAQGIEAGGHRGTFDADGGNDTELGMRELVDALCRQSGIPVVAAGGIMTGADVRAVLDAGAVAAQMGTAFLCCDEAGTSAAHRQFLLNEGARGAVYTKGFSGRRAQGISNEFIARMEGRTVLPFPIQNTLTGSLRKIAGETGDGEYQSLWAGRNYAGTRAMTAAALVEKLVGEAAI